MKLSTTSRRGFIAGGLTGIAAVAGRRVYAADAPSSNPVARYGLAWTDDIKWDRVEDVTLAPGKNWNQKFAAAQSLLSRKGGGAVYFPPGVYQFADSLHLENGIVIRGGEPQTADAKSDNYAPPTRFEFPQYKPSYRGQGTPLDTAFKGVYLNKPAEASNVGVVNVSISRGHIHFREDDGHKCGWNRLVVGCVLRNAAVADPEVPNLKLKQHAWQRFTSRHHAAIDVKASKNLLVANNRLPKSGEDNFGMNGYLLEGRKGMESLDGVVFDYDNRPGMYVNHFGIGAPGGGAPNGTPESHPWGFRKGIVIRDNYIFNTGRMAIGFSGDGVICAGNVVRFRKDVWRPTATGQNKTFGSSTNDNRAVEMRGWRWVVENNDYEVYRNWAADRTYLINDGEGLMHENHVNSAVIESRLAGNVGNAYLSIYKTGEIDGLVVEGNDIRVGGGAAIMVVADRNDGRGPCRNVTIVDNKTTGGGIVIAGSPAKNNVIRGNRHTGLGGTIRNDAQAMLDGNAGYEVISG
jgi:hypothetical protein